MNGQDTSVHPMRARFAIDIDGRNVVRFPRKIHGGISPAHEGFPLLFPIASPCILGIDSVMVG